MNIFDRTSDSTAAWKEFKQKNPGTKLTREQYKDIVRTHNSLLLDYLLDTGETYKLPYGFGPLRVKKFKQKFKLKGKTIYRKTGMSVDWPETRKLWAADPQAKADKKLIKYLNAHTDGHRYFFYWVPEKSRIYKATLWSFRVCREGSRKLAQRLKDPDGIYKDLYLENDTL